MPTLQQIYQKNPDFIGRKIGGELVLIPLQKKIYDITSIYNMNEMACEIWDRLDGRKNLDEIQQELLALYEVPSGTLSQDMQTLIEQLEEIKAVIPHAVSS
jgi:hypothetical protein